MPIPYHDTDELEELGAAAFLVVEPTPTGGTAGGTARGTAGGTARGAGAGYVGALFLVNARGEPLEFAYNQVQTPGTFLWRQADLRRHAERKLAASLLAVCERTPRLLLCRAEQVSAELFGQDLRVAVPVGRVAGPPRVDPTTGEIFDPPPRPQLSWQPAPPADGTPERRLVDGLAASGLLLEPFERAALGLREAYAADGLGSRVDAADSASASASEEARAPGEPLVG